MDIVQLVEAQDSLGFVLPDAVLARLNLAAGDTLQLTKTPTGILLTRANAATTEPRPDSVPPP
ncbi:AbrB/MazE/SpoVT family DNA-binding domain-containing protein [Pelomonas sp. Root1237]|uniref:AbrB/MazE/SpoVT family DNA-binding domain-containing protein n=1 Tax=Pelomonas sp. Root1237 TaxID=1736434 RepID=UPI000A6A5DCC|nr:AbrB/MazE/SpoVT family DNA-binding domain-containing protein [Pelomonas sp. Root1237]